MMNECMRGCSKITSQKTYQFLPKILSVHVVVGDHSPLPSFIGGIVLMRKNVDKSSSSSTPLLFDFLEFRSTRSPNTQDCDIVETKNQGIWMGYESQVA